MITAIVGAQYGSEGKGVIVSHLANEYHVHVRVGGSNAGHSHIYKGQKYKNQIVPVGWTNPNALLVIGRGALVDIELLKEEIAWIEAAGARILDRLFVDAKAGVLAPGFRQAEGGVDGNIHARIGSTGEGVGAARSARLQRDPTSFQFFGDVAAEHGLEGLITDITHEMIMEEDDIGHNVLIEGTQGSGLSLIHGPWPYVTSADTNASQMAADIGLAPSRITEVGLVARTMPIRVAGNSGPLKGEVSWEDISKKMGRPTEERTTVTKKIRRIGEWDDDLFYQAVVLNDPKWMALTFLDYLFPEVEGATSWGGLTTQAKDFVLKFEEKWGVQVRYVGTGGDNWSVINLQIPALVV